jgi:uncharacterized protein
MTQPTTDPSVTETIDSIVHGLAYSSRAPLLHTPAEAGLAFEEVSYPSSDGTPLEAWYVPCEGSDRLVVVAHAFGFNRAGFPSHLEPWRSAFGEGNDVEIDFVPDYRILHDHGYHVLAFDFRNFGLSGDANGGLQSCNRFEARDVVGTLDYVRSRPDLATMRLAIFARCMGANATFRAIHTDPDAFRDVRALVAPLLLSTRPFVETTLAKLGLEDRFEEVERRFRTITSASLDEADTSRWAPAVTMPTLTYGVREDHLTRADDLEATYAAIGARDKELFWIEGTRRRWDGYLYFQRHPERVLEWLDDHLS